MTMFSKPRHFFQHLESKRLSVGSLLIAIIGGVCWVFTSHYPYHPLFNERNWFYAAVFIAVPIIVLISKAISALFVHLIAKALKGEGTYYHILNSICYISALSIAFMPLQLIFFYINLEYIRLALRIVEDIWSIILFIKAIQVAYTFNLKKLLSVIIGDAVLVSLLAFGFIRPFIAQVYKVPSASMVPTINVGDRVLVEKLSYRFSSPKRGDVIIFKLPPVVRKKQEAVKRIVAVGGDNIEIKGGDLYVNEHPVDESKYVRRTTATPSTPGYRRDFGPFEVPEAHVFLMGDNRDRSADSRVWGAVPNTNITGKVLLIYKPEGSTRWDTIGRIIR